MSFANCPAEDALIGARIDGRYTVNSVLGQGGMGVVYEGVHDELGRHVAIKVLNAAWATDRTAVERFLREARTASSFSHSNIVDVSDLGRLADGRPYLVMPRITGIDLATLLAESGPQPAKRVAALLSGVASALDLVHAKGYVHRDIKPENLMYVVREDRSETVMLLDFGIAAAVMSSGPRLTRQGAIFGTPHYLPPEVCAGARCDARGDVYSLAAVAFELITGELPFAADDIMQLMAQKVSYDAPMLAAVCGTTFPAELERVIASGLARDPRYRYPRASAFVSALREATQGAPVSWRAGEMRPSMRSSEHALPQLGVREGWGEAERAPTWPVDSTRPARPSPGEISFDEAASYRSYPRHPTPSPRHGDESSAVRRASTYGMHDPDPPGYGETRRRATPQVAGVGPNATPSRGYAQTANPGAWAAHASHPTYSQGGGDYDTRLRMRDDVRHSTLSVRPRGSIVPVLVGVVAFAALGVGGVQLMSARRHSAQTDARASTQARPTSPVQPDQPGRSATGEGPSDAARVARVSDSADRGSPRQAPTSGETQASTAADVSTSAVRGVPSPSEGADRAARRAQGLERRGGADGDNSDKGDAPGKPGAPGGDAVLPNAPSVGGGASPRGAESAESSPRRGRHSGDREPQRLSKGGPEPTTDPEPQAKVDPASLAPSAGGVPTAEPAGGSSIVTVTPIEQPSLELAPPEPEAPAPQLDVVSAADYAKQSSSALLRGEVTRAIELARQATRADASYAIAWRSLGLALERAGAENEAIDAYGRYLQRAPTGPQADMVRQRMQALAH